MQMALIIIGGYVVAIHTGRLLGHPEGGRYHDKPASGDRVDRVLLHDSRR